MWHRADEPRQGRGLPMAISRVRAQYVGKEITTFEQRHTSVETDFRHGLGELISAYAAELPPGALGLCHAYCEALDCDGPEPAGSPRACAQLARNFYRRSDGASLPCESRLGR